MWTDAHYGTEYMYVLAFAIFAGPLIFGITLFALATMVVEKRGNGGLMARLDVYSIIIAHVVGFVALQYIEGG